jgi:chromosome segregation ATPase
VNPLTFPVGIAVRVLGDLTAIAVAARAFVELDMQEAQDDLHVLAQTARELPRVESELTRRIDDAEAILAEGIAEIRRATAAAESLAGALPTLERAANAADKLVDGLEEVRASREALLDARGEAAALIAAAERAQKSLDRASDNVEAALARAEPLQGLAERVGRLSERLPGGSQRGG